MPPAKINALGQFDSAPSGSQPDDRIVWLRYAILCDSVRTEDTGKKIYIGCYNGEVILNRKPHVVSATLAGSFEFLKSGQHSVQLRVTTQNSQGIGQLSTDGDQPVGAIGNFEIPVEAFVSEPGEIRLDWKADDQDYGPPMVWRINFAETAEQLDEPVVELMKQAWNSRGKLMLAGG